MAVSLCPDGKVRMHLRISRSAYEILMNIVKEHSVMVGHYKGSLSEVIEEMIFAYANMLAGDARAHTQKPVPSSDGEKSNLNTVSDGDGGAPSGAPSEKEKEGKTHTKSSGVKPKQSGGAGKTMRSRTMRNLEKIVEAMRGAGFEAGGEIPEHHVHSIITATVGGDRRTIMKYMGLLYQYEILEPHRRRRNGEWIWRVVRLEPRVPAPDGIRS